MKHLTTALVAILFAGFGVAKPAPPSFSNYLTTTTIYQGGSSTTTEEPILPAGNDSVQFKEGNDLVERVKRLRQDFSHYEMKVMVFVSNVNQVLTSFYFDKADNLVELTNYLPSAEVKISRSKCYCEEFAVNQTNLKESFLNFAKLLVEPARIKVRGVERNLKFVRESIRSMETLSDISWQHCRHPQNMLCFPGMTELIETKVQYYEQLAKNITKELLDTQTEIDRIEGNVHVLTEGAIKQINDARKNYTCCLKGLNFQVEGVDCAISTTKTIIQATQLPPRNGEFRCDDGLLLIPIRKVCDEAYDCMDGSDEARCDY